MNKKRLKRIIILLAVILLLSAVLTVELSSNEERAGLFKRLISQLTGKRQSEWTLGNYNDASGNQGEFYTLKNNTDGTLIVVDGGWKENAAQVRQVISDNGGHVSAWFITHTHNDHVGAFNEIFADTQGIRIDTVYDSGVDGPAYCEKIPGWDQSDIYPEYASVTSQAKNVVHLTRGETFSIDGLKVQVMNAYDEESVEACAGDIVNNTSLMFRISGEKDSILFCGDNHSESTAQLIESEYEDQLAAEYVQTGHHGNNSLPTSFYELVNPQVAVFDAPQRIMTGDEYTAKDLKAWFEERGVQTWDYSDAPHFAAFS